MFTFHRAIFLLAILHSNSFHTSPKRFRPPPAIKWLGLFFHCHRHQITLLCEFEFVWRGKFLTLWEWKDISHPSFSFSSLRRHTKKHWTFVSSLSLSISLIHIVCVCSSQLCLSIACLPHSLTEYVCYIHPRTSLLCKRRTDKTRIKWRMRRYKGEGEIFQMKC
jgi:hypothetical protein